MLVFLCLQSRLLLNHPELNFQFKLAQTSVNSIKTRAEPCCQSSLITPSIPDSGWWWEMVLGKQVAPRQSTSCGEFCFFSVGMLISYSIVLLGPRGFHIPLPVLSPAWTVAQTMQRGRVASGLVKPLSPFPTEVLWNLSKPFATTTHLCLLAACFFSPTTGLGCQLSCCPTACFPLISSLSD